MEIDVNNITLRQDFFQDKKGIHVKIDREIHSALRAFSFQKGVSMQHLFEEFALQIVSGNKKAISIVDSMILRKLNLPKRRNKYKRKKTVELSDVDKQSLYDLIDGEFDDEFEQERTV